MTPDYMKGLAERMRTLWQQLEPGTDDVVLLGKVSMILAEGAQALELAAKQTSETRAAVELGIRQMRIAVGMANTPHASDPDNEEITDALADIGRQLLTTGARVFGKEVDPSKPEELDTFHKRVSRALDMSKREKEEP